MYAPRVHRPDFNPETLSGMLEAAFVEVMPIRDVENQLDVLPADAGVTVTCSPSKGIEATLSLVEHLSQQNFRLIPHVAARQVVDTAHLREILSRLTECGVNMIFVPGGDIETPVGKFDSALQLLQSMADIEHGIDEIGIAAYPDGHPVLDDQTLMTALRAKQEFATYFVTQMCFSAETLASWLARIREQNVRLPAWIGLPGAVERKKLFADSLRIGVGESARFAKQQPKLVKKLLRANAYQPDDLVLELAPYMDDARYNIAGLHLFSFNQVEATQSWRTGFLDELGQQRSR